MIPVSIIGCGGIGQAHVNAYKQISGVQIVACVDSDLGKAQRTASSYGAKACADINSVLSDVTAVSVTTPPMNHYEIAKFFLQRGIHVFCEKPLAMRVDHAQELVNIAREQKRVLMVGFKMRFEPIFIRAKERLPMIGELIAVSATKLQPFAGRPCDWRPQVGAMYELSVHDFDLIHWITGRKPERVSAQYLGHRMGWPREDSFSITVGYSGGVVGQLSGVYAQQASFFYRDLTLTFLGEKGYLRIERPDRIVLHLDKFTVEDVPADGGNAFAAELTHFRNVINGTENNLLDGQFGLWATQIVEGANTSFREKREVVL